MSLLFEYLQMQNDRRSKHVHRGAPSRIVILSTEIGGTARDATRAPTCVGVSTGLELTPVPGALRLRGARANVRLPSTSLRLLLMFFAVGFEPLAWRASGPRRERLCDRLSSPLSAIHHSTLNHLFTITLPYHVQTDEVAQRFRTEKYKVRKSRSGFGLLVGWLAG